MEISTQFTTDTHYELTYQEFYNGLFADKTMKLTFTIDNNIYEDEKQPNCEHYECYDNNNDRFILYVNCITGELCLKSDKDPNDGKENWFYNIKNIHQKS